MVRKIYKILGHMCDVEARERNKRLC